MSRKSRRNQPTRLRNQPVTQGNGSNDVETQGLESGQTEIRKIVHQELLVASHELFSGPLPHPEHLREYENILPGSADRVIRMAEDQAKHRQSLEQTVVQTLNWNLEVKSWDL